MDVSAPREGGDRRPVLVTGALGFVASRLIPRLLERGGSVVAVVRPGRDVTVFATGTQTVRAFQAAEALAAEGIDVHLVHVPTLKPLDADGIVEAAQATGFVITSEEGSIIGGLGGAVAEVLADRFPVTVKRHGLADIFGESGPDDLLLEKFGISAAKTAEAIRAFVNARRA